MTMQLDMFAAAPATKRPARPDTALLLAMSSDHIPAPAAPPPAFRPAPAPAPAPARPAGDHKAAAKLRSMAEAMQGAIDSKNAPRRSNTPKQQRQAAEARQDAAQLERAQAIMYALADRNEGGEVPPCLAGVTTKAAILDLAKEEIDRRNAGYYDAGWPTGKPYEWRDEAKQTQARAAWALIDSAKETERREAEALRQKIEAVRFSKIPGFFPTPAALVARMIDHADLDAGAHVLEPSAGSGAIADALREAGHRVTCVERHSSLRAILEDKGHTLAGSDFFEDFTAPADPFDAVLMNPPFEQGQDCIHVRAAFQLVRPGGVLVAIMGTGVLHRQQRPFTETRDWLESLGAEIIELPAGAFAESGTGVASVMVIIHREDTAPEKPTFTKQLDAESDQGRALIQRAMDASAGLTWPQPNENGVYCEPTETLSLPRPVKGWQGCNTADIEIINLGRFWLWATGYQLQAGDCRGSSSPLMDYPDSRAPSRAAAIDAAAAHLRSRLEGLDNGDARRVLAWLDTLGQGAML